MSVQKSTRTVVLAGLTLVAMLMPVTVYADQNEVVGVAIYFDNGDGTTKPFLFHDLNAPLPRWSCEARLDYLTKMYYRMSRSNPELKGKKAVRSACARVQGFDFSDR